MIRKMAGHDQIGTEKARRYWLQIGCFAFTLTLYFNEFSCGFVIRWAPIPTLVLMFGPFEGRVFLQ